MSLKVTWDQYNTLVERLALGLAHGARGGRRLGGNATRLRAVLGGGRGCRLRLDLLRLGARSEAEREHGNGDGTGPLDVGHRTPRAGKCRGARGVSEKNHTLTGRPLHRAGAGYGDQTGSRTSPTSELSRCWKRPSDETIASVPRAPARVA